MPRKESSVSSRIAHLVLAVTAALFVVLTCAGISFAADPSEHVIHSFLGSPDGSGPHADLIADAAGLFTAPRLPAARTGQPPQIPVIPSMFLCAGGHEQ
jgi:hypothetical protein